MLLEMLKYQRPEGSKTQRKFCKRFLEPVFGKPDEHGNYVLEIGESPIAFMAHHDTVHTKHGKQKPILDPYLNHALAPKGANCLGADCTTGVWLILEMIKAEVEGIYVVHAAEEVGCKGSRALVEDNPSWLNRTAAAISFDRKGTGSVITHQMGMRTASDAFAISLAEILNLDMQPDSTGSYTDSNEYAYIIPECTNLSVGYYNQHTKNEFQDLGFVQTLRDALITADWSQLVIERNPLDFQYDEFNWNFDPFTNWVEDNAIEVASFLRSKGYTRDDILYHQYFDQAC